MKKNKLLILLLLTAHGSVFAALPTATAWELRTLGNANNGACYVTGSSGTDFSQQNSAQYTFTDLVLGVGGTTATSVSHLFVATDVGNCIHITAGTNFTQGFYQIVSVSTGILTADRSMGTAASTGGTYAVGGGIVDPHVVALNATPGNQVYVKADGTYTFTTAVSITQDSNNLTAFRWIGYTTTRTDNGRATWTTATNSINMIESSSGPANVEFDNISFTTTAGTKGDAFHARSVNGLAFLVSNCIIDGFNNGVNGDFGVDFQFTDFNLVNSEIKNSISDGIINSGSTSVIGSYIHNNGGNGVNRVNGSVTGNDVYAFSIFKSNTSSGIRAVPANNATIKYAPNLYNNVFMSNTVDGVRIELSGTAPSGSINAWNNIFYSNTGVGLDAVGHTLAPASVYSNAYGSNGGGNIVNVQAGIGDVTLTANPFVSSAANNFALNSTAGGGASLKAAGYPGVLTVGGTGFLDIGALQSSGGSGSAGTTTSGFAQ